MPVPPHLWHLTTLSPFFRVPFPSQFLQGFFFSPMLFRMPALQIFNHSIAHNLPIRLYAATEGRRAPRARKRAEPPRSRCAAQRPSRACYPRSRRWAGAMAEATPFVQSASKAMADTYPAPGGRRYATDVDGETPEGLQLNDLRAIDLTLHFAIRLQMRVVQRASILRILPRTTLKAGR